jgi:hypothetical protein
LLNLTNSAENGQGSPVFGSSTFTRPLADISSIKPPSSSKTTKDKPKSSGQYKDGNTKDLPFPVYKPWSEPVDLAVLLDDIAKNILRFIVLDPIQADAAALWVAHTYLVDLFNVSPLAIINAPEKACAKTLFLDVLAYMSFRSFSASNITAAGMFRSVELWHLTMFFDEADTFFRENKDLQGMINAGYNRNGKVIRTEKVDDSFLPRPYSVYGAKSIAGIALEKHLPDATMSRGIIFTMRRKLASETVSRLRHTERGIFEELASKLMRFAEDYAEQIAKARPTLPDELSDRAQDNWEPLLAIASCASEEWMSRALKAALKLSRINNESISTGNELLADIQQVFEARAGKDQDTNKISSNDLINALMAIEDAPWATYNKGRPISPRQLSKLLNSYGIKSKSIRFGKFDTPKGYRLEQFADMFARFLSVEEQENDIPDEIEDVVPSVAISSNHEVY